MQSPSSSAGDRVPGGGRIVVFRALPGLGDFLCAVPSLRAIRRARPDVETSLVGLPQSSSLAVRFGAYVDRFFAFPGFPGLPDRRPDIALVPGFLAAMQSWEFDLAIQLHGSGELTNPITALFSARSTAGHYPRGEAPANASGFLPWAESCSEIRRGLRLMAHLGWPSDDETLEFPVAPIGEAEAIAALGSDSLDAPYVVLHPGASTASRRWPAASFARVGDELTRAGYRVVLTGTPAEASVTAQVSGAMHEPAVDIAGRTTLDGLAVVLRRSALLVANDTGVSHLAAALRVPSVVVFSDSSVERWAPLDRDLHRVSEGSVRQVVSEARRLLRRMHRHAA